MSEYITTKGILGISQTYKIVEKIPPRFFVWNIGKNMGSDEYIPLCEPAETNIVTGLYEINRDTIKAIRLKKSEVLILREAASFGITSLYNARRVVQNEESWIRRRGLAERALPIYERITM